MQVCSQDSQVLDPSHVCGARPSDTAGGVHFFVVVVVQSLSGV